MDYTRQIPYTNNKGEGEITIHLYSLILVYHSFINRLPVGKSRNYVSDFCQSEL